MLRAVRGTALALPLLLAAGSGLGCAGRAAAPAPGWSGLVSARWADGDALVLWGVGSVMPLRNRSLACHTARNRARAALVRPLEEALAPAFRDADRFTEDPDDAEAEAATLSLHQARRLLVSGLAREARAAGTFVAEDGTVWARVELRLADAVRRFAAAQTSEPFAVERLLRLLRPGPQDGPLPPAEPRDDCAETARP